METIQKAPITMNSRAKVVDVPMHQRQFGTKQVAFVDWGINGGVVLVDADEDDQKEFGPGTFRVGKGEMLGGELIVRVDPKGMKLYFVDNQHYIETDEVRWEPAIKLKSLIVHDLAKFTAAFTAK